MQHLIFTPKNADKSSWMAIDSNEKKIHIMHTKEIRNEGITSLLQTFWIWSSHTKSLWIGWQLSLGVPVGPMGELDLEVGGRQKNTTNASIKQGKNHNFLTTMKAKKMKNTAVLFKLGYSYSVALCLLSSWRRFFHWIASSFNSVIWQNPRLKFVFRMHSCPWYL